MNWHYEENGQALGPITQPQFDEFVRSGRITASTLVWNEGLTGWTKYGDLSGGTVSQPPRIPTESSAPGHATCSQCGRSFPEHDLLKLNNVLICAACKPIAIQRLREGKGIAGSGIARSGKALVTTLDSTLPDRCIKCNATATGKPVKRTLYWHHPLIYFLLLAGILVYAIVAIIARRKAIVHFGVCDEHRKKRNIAVLITWICCLGGMVTFFAGFGQNNPAFMLWGGGVIFLFGVIVGMARGRYLYAEKVDKEIAKVRGCGADFLASFPEWDG